MSRCFLSPSPSSSQRAVHVESKIDTVLQLVQNWYLESRQVRSGGHNGLSPRFVFILRNHKALKKHQLIFHTVQHHLHCSLSVQVCSAQCSADYMGASESKHSGLPSGTPLHSNRPNARGQVRNQGPCYIDVDAGSGLHAGLRRSCRWQQHSMSL